MPRQYSSSVRRQIVARLRSGERVTAVAVDAGICEATLFRWKRQALIDAGVIEGTASVEADELIARGHSGRSACRITGLTRSLLRYHRRRPVPDREVRRLILTTRTYAVRGPRPSRVIRGGLSPRSPGRRHVGGGRDGGRRGRRRPRRVVALN